MSRFFEGALLGRVLKGSVPVLGVLQETSPLGGFEASPFSAGFGPGEISVNSGKNVPGFLQEAEPKKEALFHLHNSPAGQTIKEIRS